MATMNVLVLSLVLLQGLDLVASKTIVNKPPIVNKPAPQKPILLGKQERGLKVLFCF